MITKTNYQIVNENGKDVPEAREKHLDLCSIHSRNFKTCQVQTWGRTGDSFSVIKRCQIMLHSQQVIKQFFTTQI